MLEDVSADGISLWDDQGAPLSARQLIQLLLDEVVDLDAPVLIGSMSSSGDVEITRPVELEVTARSDEPATVLWIYERPRKPSKPGLR